MLEGGYPSEDGVLHFKVDEEERTILAVSRSGGVTVHTMEDNRVLWQFGKVPWCTFKQRSAVNIDYRITSSVPDVSSRTASLSSLASTVVLRYGAGPMTSSLRPRTSLPMAAL